MKEINSCETYDYIIIGAGSSGAVVASRLAEAGVKVLLLEAGPKDRSLWFQIPAGYYKTVGNPKYDWGYISEPETELGSRQLKIPRGRVVGGCGVINGLCYVRGQHADFNRWETLGAKGWSWQEVEPYFKKLEGCREPGSAFGTDGPIILTRSNQRGEICEAFLKAAEANGLPPKKFFEGDNAEGFVYTLTNIRDGWRSSSVSAYLKPLLKRGKIKIETRALCEAVLFNGKEAVGVRFRKGGISTVVHARREVILSAGVFNTPQILQLSGIGPAELLQPLGIEVVQNLKGVGQNLQEHFLVELEYKLNRPLSLNDNLRNPIWKIKAALEWLFRKTGPLTYIPAPIIGFARSHSRVERPDLQFHFLPITLDENRNPHRFSGVGIDVYQTRPGSRGEVKISSSDPLEKPVIEFRFLSTEKDRQITIAGIRRARAIARTKPFSSFVEMEHSPGSEYETDDELLAYARGHGFFDYHPVGTCKMGNDKEAVVDHRLRVRGVTNLRVVDCSVMPEIVSANTNAAAMMIGERGADMVLQDARG